jgi:DNA-binding NtrC family response regulator
MQQQQDNATTQEPFAFPKGNADELPTLAEWNARYIDYVLNYTKGKKTAAARILGINRRTLYRRNKGKAAAVPANAEDNDVSMNNQVTH